MTTLSTKDSEPQDERKTDLSKASQLGGVRAMSESKHYECNDCGAYITSSGPMLSQYVNGDKQGGCTMCGSLNVKRVLKDVITPEMEAHE